MLTGIIFALSAGLMWGLIFIGPLLIPDYPAALQSTGRYLAFGLIALPLAWSDRARLTQLTLQDWLEALKLSTIGNLLYYLCLASAIKRTGAPITTMIIGTLPVVIAISANLLYSRHDGRLSWRRLTPALGLIAVGLILVNIAEITNASAPLSLWNYLSGMALALLAVVCWTWYPLRNARWLRQHPDKNPGTWATAQGVATLPLALVGYLLVGGYLALTEPHFALPFGPRPEVFITLMVIIGLFSSWLGTLCWNEASQRLPTVLVGPLLVFETLAGLAYTFLLRQSWPPLLTLCGIICLISGVIYTMRIKPKPMVSTVSPPPMTDHEHG
ncbi:DMT family transporter [Pectobacteriaceae bacterium CE90]|nr:DMT family transporter [Prodigiosinella sp. LS101]WJV52306.1 DMT family transporter [Prodigiosinella sp. LS101]WJV56660.1 DMT family transporter [Pectobacteriaceae bacterium C111]WJY13732.1 DMT family transporter [Pectobacteriaceae bacterium CE90]